MCDKGHMTLTIDAEWVRGSGVVSVVVTRQEWSDLANDWTTVEQWDEHFSRCSDASVLEDDVHDWWRAVVRAEQGFLT